MKCTLASCLIATSFATLLATSAPATPAEPVKWQATWIAPAQPVWGDGWVVPLGMPTVLRGVTLRQQLRTSLGGHQLRLVISNQYGSSPLKLGAASVRRIAGGQAFAVRFEGREATHIAQGAQALSDPVALASRPGDRLEVDLHLPDSTRIAGFHWSSQEQAALLQGNAVGRRDAPLLKTFTTRAFLSEVRVASTRPVATVVAIGDSITDGKGSTMGRDQRWPDHLSNRLASHGVAVLNAGIAGNRLLRGGWGESALARFDRDVLGHAGVRAVVVLLGTNDIGFPGSPFAPADRPVALREITGGFQQLVKRAHAQGVRVIAGTVPPFGQALQGTPLEGHYSPAKEAVRQALNHWIRTAGVFDGVVDFDAVLRDPANPARLDPPLDSGDHLHPSDVGYRRMAEAIDIRVLLGQGAEGGPR